MFGTYLVILIILNPKYSDILYKSLLNSSPSYLGHDEYGLYFEGNERIGESFGLG